MTTVYTDMSFVEVRYALVRFVSERAVFIDNLYV